MATRLYFSNTQSVLHPTENSGAEWDHVNTAIADRQLLKTPDGSTLANGTYTPDAADHLVDNDSMVLLYVLEGIELAAQTINAQAVKWQVQCNESNNGCNQFLSLKIFICGRDGTVKETLLALKRDATEMANSLINRGDSSTTSSASVEDGDRICVEMGCGGTPTSATGVNGHNCTIRSGCDASSGDLPEDNTETGTTFRPWIEFAENLDFIEFMGGKLL